MSSLRGFSWLHFMVFCKLHIGSYRNPDEWVWHATWHRRDVMVADMTGCVRWRGKKSGKILNGLRLNISWKVSESLTVWFGFFFAVSRDPDMLIGSLIFHARANKTLGLGKVKPSLFFCSLYSVSIYLQHFAENTNSLEAFKYIILIKNLTVTQKFKIVIKEN